MDIRRYVSVRVLSIFVLAVSYIMPPTTGQDVVAGRGNRRPTVSPGCDTFHSCAPGDELVRQETDKGCYCDELCNLYGDCCTNAIGDREVWAPYQELPPASVCRTVHSRDIRYNLYYVFECPSDYNDDAIRTQCEDVPRHTEDMLLKLPVSHREHGFVFNNIFCAVCHGFVQADLFFWNVNVTCEIPKAGMIVNMSSLSWEDIQLLPYEQILQLGVKCHEYLSVPNGQVEPRGCLRGLRDTCARDWDEPAVANMCVEAGTRLVSQGRTAYKNKFCARCNHVTRFDCTHASSPNLPSGSIPATVVPISILFDFNSRVITVAECRKNEIYDALNDRCRALSCGPGFRLQRHECVSLAPAFSSIQQNITTVCPRILLGDSEYAILTNTSLYLNDSKSIISNDSYVIIDNQVYVCADAVAGQSSILIGEYSIDAAQGIISLCGQIISILSLLVLLLVYGCFKKLRNIPGKCLMCLAASLAGAQVLFVVGMYSRELRIFCKVIAILTHFCFLVAFCWMNAMAFDVWRTFHKQFRLSARSKKINNFICYCIYTTLLPLILVVTGITFDQLQKDYLPYPDYGYLFCWISQKQALFYLFVLPVFVLILSNCVLFSLSVYHIYRASSALSVLREGSKGAKKKRLILYAKLSTIMGLTWIFGFAASLTGNNILWYLFVIFNSLQGLFICLAFLCNRKVYRLIAARALRMAWSHTTASKTTSSMVDTNSYRKKESATQAEIEILKQTAESSDGLGAAN